ncbi:MAG: site-2 protease family protein [Persicimonas sp.]
MFERQGYHFFTYRNVDVAVSPWYLLLMAFIVFGPLLRAGGGMQASGMASGILFAVAVTVSLLVHEFGHAFVSKHYSLSPSVLLHAFGGLCMHRPAETDAKDALILGAGPAAGLALGAGVFLAQIFVLPMLPLGSAGPVIGEFAMYLLWVNIVWSLVNLLLPIWPLDGGQLFHLGLRRFMEESRAQDLALKVSIFFLIPAGIISLLYLKQFFIGLLCFFLLMNNVSALRSGGQLVGRKAKTRASDFQKELFDSAEQALDEGDHREAYRLCHQIRSTGEIPQKMLARVWEILAITAVEMERFDEAESYLERAPDTAAVRRARQLWQDHAR